ncbi:MAG: NifB/NifX family molybdenum-iron cluster-binding protein [Bacteroidales bacterium]
MNLRFAFALNTKNQFEKDFFGNADKFMIYELVSGKLEKVFEIENEFKDETTDSTGINEQKAENITKKLIAEDIKVIVSKQFGENIKLVNEYFIPIKIFSDLPDDAIQAINSHVHWVEDELSNFSSEYKLFIIKSGILKTSIDKN